MDKIIILEKPQITKYHFSYDWNQVRVEWKPVPGATSYEVELIQKNGNPIKYTTTEPKLFAGCSLSSETEHPIKVCARTEHSSGDYSVTDRIVFPKDIKLKNYYYYSDEKKLSITCDMHNEKSYAAVIFDEHNLVQIAIKNSTVPTVDLECTLISGKNYNIWLNGLNEHCTGHGNCTSI